MIAGIEAYIAHCRRKGQAPSTRKIKQSLLLALADWLSLRGIESWQEVKERDLRAYANQIRWAKSPVRRGNLRSLSSLYTEITQVRSFFRYLTQQGHLLWDPAQDLSCPMFSRIPRIVLSQGQMEALLCAPNPNTPVGVRDRAWLEVLYATGIRRGELLALTLSDLDLKEGMLTVRKGKGGKSRRVPLGEEATKWLLRYIREVRPLLLSGAVFRSCKICISAWHGQVDQWFTQGNCIPRIQTELKKRGFLVSRPTLQAHKQRHFGKRTSEPRGEIRKDPGHLWLTRESTPMDSWILYERLKYYCEKTGLCERMSPHGFRSTCATHLLDEGADLRHVQEFLGHADLSTTQVYLSRSKADLARMLKNRHPRSHFPLDDGPKNE